MTWTASGATSTRRGRIARTMPIVDSARSRRDWPGFCLAPAVKTMTSESASTSTSSDPSTCAIGTNWMPWLRSSASACTLAALTSKSETVWATPRIKAAYARVAPTAPAPTMPSLVRRRRRVSSASASTVMVRCSSTGRLNWAARLGGWWGHGSGGPAVEGSPRAACDDGVVDLPADAVPSLEGYPVLPPALRPPVVFDQVWRDVTFVHWPVDPDSVRHLFPAGTRPDVFADGLTYVALVPFVMDGIRLGRAPSPRLPWLGSFLETNIRLYSVVAAARAGLGIPYTWARMRLRRDDDLVTYESRRRAPSRGLRSLLIVRVGDRVEPTPLETWLTARWGAHTRVAGRTLWVPNEHEAWPLYAAGVVELADDLLGASGVTPAGPRLRALWSPGVATRFGRPSRVA